MVTIDAADCSETLGQIRELFKEYAAGLGQQVTMAEFARELRGLPGEYGPPHGCLLLASCAGQPAGCVALRPITAETAEIRRLYVRHPFRGKGVGRSLTEAVLERASRCGYRTVRLEALNWMTEAIALYTAMGFQPTIADGAGNRRGTVELEYSTTPSPPSAIEG